MPDVKVNVTGTGSGHLDYPVPGGVEFILKQAYASFDGTAAASAWYPAVRLIGPDGNVAGEYITTASVAAAGSADVTFAPFLRGASAGGSGAAATDFGLSSWAVPLINFHGAADILASSGVDFVYDSAASSGGYVTHATPALNDFFVVLVALHPQSGIYGFTFTYYGGSDYGILSVDIASILYQSSLRPTGNHAGKIQDIFRSGSGVVANYGADPVFLNLITQDCYSATPVTETNFAGTITFVPGGAEGAVLSTLSASTDPYTGVSISDGGPGWYALRFQVRSKNASSSNYRFRVPMVSVLRVPDGQGF